MQDSKFLIIIRISLESLEKAWVYEDIFFKIC